MSSCRLNSMIVSLLCALFLFTGSASVYAFGKDRIVRVGVYENEPKVFTSESGKPAGIFVDIIEKIAERENWKVEYVQGTWAEGLERLSNAEIDLMPDVAFSPERGKRFSFHKVPVLSSWSQVYSGKKVRIQSILDLDRKRIAVLDGSVQQEAFSKLAGSFGREIIFIPVSDYRTMFGLVEKGGADACIANRFFGLQNSKQYNLEETPVIFDPSDLFFAAPLNGSRQILDTIDQNLSDMKKDPQSVYHASLRKWISEDIRFEIPLWIEFLALAVCTALMVSFAGSLFLKHQVNARTKELQLINREMEMRIAERTKELAAINDEQRIIFESATSGIVFMKDRIIMRCNRKLEEIFGYDQGELAGKPTRVWFLDDADFAAAGEKIYSQLSEGRTYRWEQQMARKDGTLFWARLGICAYDKEDSSKGAVGIVEDITEERDATEKLQKAMEEAQAADRIKSAFLATMSHELRTPLNSIIGFTGVILKGLAGPLNPEQHKQMTMVQSSSHHLLSLINDVLDISKIEAGQFKLSCSSFDLRESIEKAVRTVSPLADKKGITLTTDISGTVGIIRSDQLRLEQVILNLLNNAVKFTEKGTAGIACRRESDNYILSVSDTGIGIKQDEIPNLFQPFYQIDSGLARKREGTGLGLSICRNIIEIMNGSIEVESRLGYGSTFTVRVPVVIGDQP